jgi:hypothetical protein
VGEKLNEQRDDSQEMRIDSVIDDGKKILS